MESNRHPSNTNTNIKAKSNPDVVVSLVESLQVTSVKDTASSQVALFRSRSRHLADSKRNIASSEMMKSTLSMPGLPQLQRKSTECDLDYGWALQLMLFKSTPTHRSSSWRSTALEKRCSHVRCLFKEYKVSDMTVVCQVIG
jgi:hypothetical protein